MTTLNSEYQSPMEVSLKINGVVHDLDVYKDDLLLWILRDELKILSPKFGCGMGLCGACTVHVNNKAIRSCITRIDSLNADCYIVTFEGLESRLKAAITQAWIEHDVPQCGYCQIGQMMGFAALCMASSSPPRDEEIDSVMHGHICRCGTYSEIRQAIKTVLANLWAVPSDS